MRYKLLVQQLQQYQVVALPTDTIYGLSCLPHPQAITRLLRLKNRSATKGLILLSNRLEYLAPFIDVSIQEALARKYQTITRPTTFVVPSAHPLAVNNTLAVRMTDNKDIALVCDGVKSALISTSANKSGARAITHLWQLHKYFPHKINAYIAPRAGSMQVSTIINLISGEVYR